MGVQRPLKTARYLAENGWDVTVLTVADPPTSMLDPGLLSELPESVRVERAWSLEPTRVLQSLRRRRERTDHSSTPISPADGSRGFSGLPRWLVRCIQSLFIPDEKFWWTPWAVRLGRRLHRETPFDCILSSGPPFTALGIARRLSRDLGVPWVADLRDPIIDGYFFTPPTPLHSALMRGYERRVVRSAVRVVVVTHAMERALTDRYAHLAHRFVTVPNGFDPADFVGPVPSLLPGFSLTYVGALQGDIRADRLFAAAKLACERDTELAVDLRLRLVGPSDPETDAAIEHWGVADIVERLGFVGHAEAIAEMRRSPVLVLLLAPGPEHAYILTGKLPEYLASGRAVLALVPEGVAADVIRRSNAGWVVHPNETEAAASAILDAYRLWKRAKLPVPDARIVGEFDRRRLTSRVGAILEDVVADAS